VVPAAVARRSLDRKTTGERPVSRPNPYRSVRADAPFVRPSPRTTDGPTVAEIEEEFRLAAGLTALREQAGLSQRELARKMGISQPRIAAIERSRNVTIDVLEQYVGALGGRLELTVVKGRKKIPLISSGPRQE
jgi:ribosome-binding protein aMBF1 (putative translation factor)